MTQRLLFARSARRRDAVDAAVHGEQWLRRLLRVQMVSSAADAMFTVSLAGSLFFSVSVDAARPRVLAYLLGTLVPFAVVGPLLAPLVDRVRGGHRAIFLAAAAGRSLACIVLAWNLQNLLLLPVAFSVLVLGKTALVSRSVLLPRLVVDDHELVAGNARLSRLASLGGIVGGVVGASVLRLSSPSVVVLVAATTYAAAAAIALRLPRQALVPTSASRVVETVELTGARLGLAAAAMSIVRFAAGFVTFLVALTLRSGGERVWVFGVVLLAGVVAGLTGSVLGPVLRRRVGEDALLGAALIVLAACSLVAAGQGVRSGAILATFVFGIAGAVAHQAFMATVQRLAPDAEMGRAFARFDSRFQLVWVVGAVGPLLVAPSRTVGFGVLGCALVVGAIGYETARRSLRAQAALGASVTADDPVPGLVSLAGVLATRGDCGLAVLVATEAARVASARRRTGQPLPTELLLLWLSASRGAVTSTEAAARALAIVADLTGVHAATVGVTSPTGVEPTL